MDSPRAECWSRREFLSGLTLAGAAGLLGLHPGPIAAEPPPETTRLKLARDLSLCVAPQHLAEAFLRAEGFTDVQYVRTQAFVEVRKGLATGELDISMQFGGSLIISIDVGDPLVLLSGAHVGCFELFGTERVRAIRDLKGKTVAVPGLGSPYHAFLSIMAAYVGLDPRKDINWVTSPQEEAIQLLAEGKIDAFLSFPPGPQILRAKKIGHVVVNGGVDRPWSQYYCCMVAGNRDFVRKHPVATKRALRAILRAANLCAVEPQRAARQLVDNGYTESYDYAFETMKHVVYGKWREYNPEDTVRFYALRLHEADMIKLSPQKIIVQGTDWRFLNELKKEMKG